MSFAGETRVPGSGRFYIPGLDGIRALAVLLIFVFHAEILPKIPGELATTTFLFLSGFLITTLFVREHKKTGDVDVKAFFYRRALRIFPPLYLVLGLALVMYFFAGVHYGNGKGTELVDWKVASSFLHFTNYAFINSSGEGVDALKGFLPGMVLLWSLAIDEHFYVLFAPVFKAATKWFTLKKLMVGILVVCGLILAWRLHLLSAMGGPSGRQTLATDARMDSILWGVFLALWRNPALEPKKAAWLAHPALVVLGFAALLGPTLLNNEAFKVTYGFTLNGIGLIPIFAAAMLHGGKTVFRFLDCKPLFFISQISYPLYLLQWLVLMTCYTHLPGSKPVQFLIAFAITFAGATAIHFWVERPVAKLRKKRPDEKPTVLTLEPALEKMAS